MDTTREIEELQNELWMKRSVRERAKFMFGMFATARKVVINFIAERPFRKGIQASALFQNLRRTSARRFF